MLIPDTLPPIDPNAPLDPVALIHDAIAIWQDWKTAGPIAALTLLVWILTQISKNTWLLQRIPTYWRPYVALVLGVAGGSISALASGAKFWPSAVMAGIAAGAGSIAFDQLLSQWKARAIALATKQGSPTGGGTGPGPNSTATKIGAVTLALLIAIPQSSCAFFQKVETTITTAISASPDCKGDAINSIVGAIEADVDFIIAIVKGVAGSDPIDAILTAYTTAKGTPAAKCEFEVAEYVITGHEPAGVVSPDAGTVIPAEPPSALELALKENLKPEDAQGLFNLQAFVVKHNLQPTKKGK